ncbi:hypothetical protein ACO0LF_18985 [Undibacterium sp. Di27W]|uniref:phosphorylase family protein n=1 Tax=Undibacterium sp. Di27W TaxID=3413036 RepID=UPI003BF22881
MKIVILFPTQTEASLFQREGIISIVSGVGLTATAHASLQAIYEYEPDLLIMAGIAGAYPHSSFKLGDVALVESEVEGDLGFFTPDGFTHLAHLPIDMEFERRHTLHCPHIPAGTGLPRARSMSLNAAMAHYVDTEFVDLENMEGAAFFYTCLRENQPFLELRAVSNFVNVDNDEWDMQGSIKAMTKALHQLLDDIQH